MSTFANSYKFIEVHALTNYASLKSRQIPSTIPIYKFWRSRRIPSATQNFFQIHPHGRSHHEVHPEEPSRTHQQILHPSAYYFEEYHLQDREKPDADHAGNNGTA